MKILQMRFLRFSLKVHILRTIDYNVTDPLVVFTKKYAIVRSLSFRTSRWFFHTPQLVENFDEKVSLLEEKVWWKIDDSYAINWIWLHDNTKDDVLNLSSYPVFNVLLKVFWEEKKIWCLWLIFSKYSPDIEKEFNLIKEEMKKSTAHRVLKQGVFKLSIIELWRRVLNNPDNYLNWKELNISKFKKEREEKQTKKMKLLLQQEDIQKKIKTRETMHTSEIDSLNSNILLLKSQISDVQWEKWSKKLSKKKSSQVEKLLFSIKKLERMISDKELLLEEDISFLSKKHSILVSQSIIAEDDIVDHNNNMNNNEHILEILWELKKMNEIKPYLSQ